MNWTNGGRSAIKLGRGIAREYAYRMPLESRDIRNLDKQPLTGRVLEAGLLNSELHSSTRMNKDSLKLGLPPSPDLPINALAEVQNARPDREPPTLIPKTMLGVIEGKSALEVRVGRVSNETARGVGVKGDHEEKREVVRVPEGLEALGSDFLMSSGVHNDHDEEHEVTGDTTGLGVVNLEGDLGSDF